HRIWRGLTTRASSQRPGGPSLQPVVPASHAGAFGRHFEARYAHELDGDAGRDVGDGELVAAYERRCGLRQMGVELAQLLHDFVLVGLAPGGNLRSLELGHERVGMPED